ncbi:hypothetical protein I3843_04G174400 [Carya illinoinensis]|uniref:Poly [ADP-ribose] polymerase n=1 Tax=Carya illinoinensis TaxID=32201 RepID=A0A922JSL7_CARIL|nr:hypothetical protein I3760_04G183100 [Carya illinoinensis]KAG6719046.1 hypothetical protein I3842_04G184000 [Carya illinoinensis]KAG7984701.1 hypothetical protein I3843_04G174400 [Carya illinoinensis]
MANPPKPWKAEYAKSSRSSCKTCKSAIDKEVFRLGKMVQATQFDGFMPMWNHATCILKKAKQIKSIDDVEGIELLRWEDQQKIRKYVEGSGSPASTAVTTTECGIEVAQFSRATCKQCSQKIMKGEVRISIKPDGQGARGLVWNHANCFLESSPSTEVEKLSGWKSLSASDQAAVSTVANKVPSNAKGGTEIKIEETKELLQQSTSKAGIKRKKDVQGDQNPKVAKAAGDTSASRAAYKEYAANSIDERPKGTDLDSKLETQSKELWALKDDLKKHVTTAELRQMLEANDQDSTGSELDLRERCVDAMMFGALSSCPICAGSLRYSGGLYRCHGFLSAWSKCSYSTREPERLKGKWKVPEEINNQYLSKWFKSQKKTKPVRILPPPAYDNSSGSQAINRSSQSAKSESLGDLRVAVSGLPKESMEKFKRKIEGEGGLVHTKIKKDTNCLVVSGVLDDQNAETRKARRMKLPIVREDYLVDCVKKQKKLPFDSYKVEAIGESSSMVTVKVKGRSAVHESSGLQDTGHILEEGKIIYNTTLSMSDLSTGVNSYYILQIIQDDKGSDCYVFRKWGRVGNEKIGGTKLEEMSKSDAIHEFKRLFLEKTGNPWEAWAQKQNFQKQPGRFFPLDIDYGVTKQVSKNRKNDAASNLAPELVELMKMLFNVETYRAAMMEFEINMAEMPLGKLSKRNVQKGFEALTEIQNLLNNNAHDPSVKESLIIDASNRFFTMIPSIHPHIIRDEDDFKSKDWTLELEEVFSLERKGEFDKFAPYRERLKNRMLLWHGSRLTNFVGILSQGLRIAPPEAPATGYMFGKGIYFADLVSKSAQYCYTDKKNPVGLMLLSEVALGEVYELKKAKYIEKPPEGKHSTKGLGKNIPLESEYARWRDGIVVPCGKPVPSKLKASELMYNEYIVYDTAQVKMQFLLKVKFHHKR